jgi:hypothetical protein
VEDPGVCGGPAQEGSLNDLVIPRVCPHCHSTAIEEGIAQARCTICGWLGTPEDLLQVVSSGLTLEAIIQKLTKDLLDLFAVSSAKHLGHFLVRWDIVRQDDPDTMKVVVARIVGAMAGEILRWCAGADAPHLLAWPDFKDESEEGEEDGK